MNTYYIIVDGPAVTRFAGSLDECSIKVRELTAAQPNFTFTICKVLPVSTHCFHHYRTNKVFPDRREVAL